MNHVLHGFAVDEDSHTHWVNIAAKKAGTAVLGIQARSTYVRGRPAQRVFFDPFGGQSLFRRNTLGTAFDLPE